MKSKFIVVLVIFSFIQAKIIAQTYDVVSLVQESVQYKEGNNTFEGFVSYSQDNKAKKPIVIIIHELWGVGDYVKNRAIQLAQLGYIAFAIDLYGKGKFADNPTDAGKLASELYKNPLLAKQRFDAALLKIKTFTNADTNRIAAIGYCFGGAMALNMARFGENLKAVVSFHGNLNGIAVDKKLFKSKVLICHGNDDKFVSNEEVTSFKNVMDSLGIKYTFKSYPKSTHAFTNPAATAIGIKFSIPIAYNKDADIASWNDMKKFLKKELE